jgi:hypothetical protein
MLIVDHWDMMSMHSSPRLFCEFNELRMWEKQNIISILLKYLNAEYLEIIQPLMSKNLISLKKCKGVLSFKLKTQKNNHRKI